MTKAEDKHSRHPLIGHTSPNGGTEGLDEHSLAVAERAEEFAAKFGAGDLGRAVGLLHDLGKAKPGFQDYLFGRRSSVPHSADGALFATQHCKDKIGRLLAFPIAGHHSGLANGADPGGGTAPLNERIRRAETVVPWFDLARLPELKAAPAPLISGGRDPFAWMFFIRMLFSALVDADFLETERWYSAVEGRTIERGWQGTLAELKVRLDARLAEFEPDRDDLARLRSEVLDDCRAAASDRPGLFSLTVPTGGGKTLSSLAFAIDHAIKHQLDRVIYVIPFTSIVEQTAGIFSEICGHDAVLEHHSGFDSESRSSSECEADAQGMEKLKLAAQNWDRPIVVTTAVQFFESLFASRTSRCRKLHNIARSVIILDEAQTLPLNLLRPCLAALNELVRGYGTSVVLCTATQPALTKSAGLNAPEALSDPNEIVKRGRNLHGRLKRVHAMDAGVLSDADLVAGLSSVDHGLVIVNNRRHARELFEVLRDSGVKGARHLTTAMTASHRQSVLKEIRADLVSQGPRPARVISTSLIEAGVDISFQTVWRAWAGLDQIVQAAGRCNREGELGPLGGILRIFQPEDIEGRKPPRELEQNAKTARRVLADGIDPLSPEAIQRYFRELLWTRDDGKDQAALDSARVGDERAPGIIADIHDKASGLDFRFADVAEAFRMIEDVMVPVIIPASAHAVAGASDDLLNRLRFAETTGGIARKLQRHVVQVPRMARAAMVAADAVEIIRPKELGDQFVVLNNLSLYSNELGLNWSDPTFRHVSSLIM